MYIQNDKCQFLFAKIVDVCGLWIVCCKLAVVFHYNNRENIMRSFIPALNSIDQKIFVMIRSFKLKWSAVVVRGVASDLWLVSGEWWVVRWNWRSCDGVATLSDGREHGRRGARAWRPVSIEPHLLIAKCLKLVLATCFPNRYTRTYLITLFYVPR